MPQRNSFLWYEVEVLYMAEVWSGFGGGVEGVFSRPNGWE